MTEQTTSTDQEPGTPDITGTPGTTRLRSDEELTKVFKEAYQTNILYACRTIYELGVQDGSTPVVMRFRDGTSRSTIPQS